MKRFLTLFAAASLVLSAAPATAQDRDRERDRRPQDEARDRVRQGAPPLSQGVPPNCSVSRTLPDGSVVIRCQVSPGVYEDRVLRPR